MSWTILLAFLGALLGPLPGSASDGPRVVATIPDLADVARELGGDRLADVTTLAKGTMNLHAVPLRPSSLVATSRADLFLQMGLSLEHAWVPGLLLRARNDRIQPGAPGFVNASEGWEAIDVPEEVSRGLAADLHPQGNPHFNLDPRAGRHLADRVLAGLVAVDPAGREHYERRHAAYVARLGEAEERWAKLRARFAGETVVAYHPDFDYFTRSAGIVVAGTLEPKPGVPPTPAHLGALIQRMREEGIDVILTARWSNNKSVRFVAEKTGARVVELPVLVGGVPGADSWIAMMDVVHARLAEAFAADG